MKTLFVLLAKDLVRARRNPLPWVIFLIIPLCLTGLLGLSFGGKHENGGLGQIHFAIVDEDATALTRLLRGALDQQRADQTIDAVFIDRKAALKGITAGKLSAAIIIPEHFTRDYFSGDKPTHLELIKNPAQSIHPAVVEEFCGVVITALNALSRNLQADFPAWQKLFTGEGDFHTAAALVEQTGNRLQALRKYVAPPLVGYAKVDPGQNTTGSGPGFNLFAYLLAGMTGMFLLFEAANGMNDLPRELRLRTFARYQTLHNSALPFLAGKMIFTVVLLMMCGGIMLGGGTWIFRIHWQAPVALIGMLAAYACFGAGFMALLTVLMPDERRGSVVTTLSAMMLGLAGGCAFPAEQFPAFLREHVTAHLPSFWFADTLRRLQTNGADFVWEWNALKLLALAAVFAVLAARLSRVRMQMKGGA